MSSTPRPSAASFPPVVLIHGTNDTSAIFDDLAAALTRAGREVVALDYGRDLLSVRGRLGGGGIADIVTSAKEIAKGVDDVLASTGASKVDLIGHSQGGLHAHLFVLGGGDVDLAARAVTPVAAQAAARAHYRGASRVARVVTLGSTVHGASPLGAWDALAHLAPMGVLLDRLLGPSARQQVRGSDVIAWLARAPDAAPGVSYTSIATRRDTTVRPAEAQHLAPGPGVRNIWVQDVYPASTVGHADLPRDPDTIALILAALSEPLESPDVR